MNNVCAFCNSIQVLCLCHNNENIIKVDTFRRENGSKIYETNIIVLLNNVYYNVYYNINYVLSLGLNGGPEGTLIWSNRPREGVEYRKFFKGLKSITPSNAFEKLKVILLFD